jgi:hypothetical protein
MDLSGLMTACSIQETSAWRTRDCQVVLYDVLSSSRDTVGHVAAQKVWTAERANLDGNYQQVSPRGRLVHEQVAVETGLSHHRSG